MDLLNSENEDLDNDYVSDTKIISDNLLRIVTNSRQTPRSSEKSVALETDKPQDMNTDQNFNSGPTIENYLKVADDSRDQY